MSKSHAYSKYISVQDLRYLESLTPSVMKGLNRSDFIANMCRIYYFIPQAIMKQAAASKWECYNTEGYLETFEKECEEKGIGQRGKGIGLREAKALKVINESVEKRDDFREKTEGIYNIEKEPIDVPEDEQASRSRTLMGKAIEYEIDKKKMFPIEVKSDNSKTRDFEYNPPKDQNSKMVDEEEVKDEDTEWGIEDPSQLPIQKEKAPSNFKNLSFLNKPKQDIVDSGPKEIEIEMHK